MPFDIHPAIIWSVAIGSLIMLGASILIMPAIVIRIPPDYFNHSKRPRMISNNHGVAFRLAFKIAKNILGAMLVLMGIAMLALPGQGLLTFLVGFLLVDIPGKYRVEKWMLRRGLIRPINWLRKRHSKEPLKLDDAGR